MNKKTLLKVVGIVVLIVVSIVVWEQLHSRVADWFNGEPVVYERQEQSPVTLETLVSQRAEAWLSTPEAMEYAKKVVTNNLLDELGKE